MITIPDDFNEKELATWIRGSVTDAKYAADSNADTFRGGARAAVLMPLLPVNGEWHMLFQQRALDIEMQPGDVCFPGGHTEAAETPLDTVLREVGEELCVTPSQIELLRTLPERPGPGGLTVTPFIGILHDYAGGFDRAEVDHVFTVPLRALQAVQKDVYEVPGEPVIWGFTARLVTAFLKLFAEAGRRRGD